MKSSGTVILTEEQAMELFSSYEQEAQDYLASENYTQALLVAERAIAMFPDVRRVIPVRVGKAKALAGLQRFSEAEILLTDNLVTNPSSACSWSARAGVYWDLAVTASAELETQYYELALSDYNISLEIDPSDSVDYFNKAAILEALGRYQEAVVSCEQSLLLNPDDDQAQELLQNLSEKLASSLNEPLPREGSSSPTTSIESTTSSTLSSHGLYALQALRYEELLEEGRQLLLAGNFAQAKLHYQRAMDVSSENKLEAFKGLGDSCAKLGDYLASLTYYHLAITEGSSHASLSSATKYLETIRMRFVAVLEALHIKNDRIAENTYYLADFSIALQYYDERKYADALAKFQELSVSASASSAEQCGFSPLALLYLADTHKHLGNFKEAASSYDAYLIHIPYDRQAQALRKAVLELAVPKVVNTRYVTEPDRALNIDQDKMNALLHDFRIKEATVTHAWVHVHVRERVLRILSHACTPPDSFTALERIAKETVSSLNQKKLVTHLELVALHCASPIVVHKASGYSYPAQDRRQDYIDFQLYWHIAVTLSGAILNNTLGALTGEEGDIQAKCGALIIMLTPHHKFFALFGDGFSYDVSLCANEEQRKSYLSKVVQLSDPALHPIMSKWDQDYLARANTIAIMGRNFIDCHNDLDSKLSAFSIMSAVRNRIKTMFNISGEEEEKVTRDVFIPVRAPIIDPYALITGVVEYVSQHKDPIAASNAYVKQIVKNYIDPALEKCRAKKVDGFVINNAARALVVITHPVLLRYTGNVLVSSIKRVHAAMSPGSKEHKLDNQYVFQTLCIPDADSALKYFSESLRYKKDAITYLNRGELYLWLAKIDTRLLREEYCSPLIYGGFRYTFKKVGRFLVSLELMGRALADFASSKALAPSSIAVSYHSQLLRFLALHEYTPKVQQSALEPCLPYDRLLTADIIPDVDLDAGTRSAQLELIPSTPVSVPEKHSESSIGCVVC